MDPDRASRVTREVTVLAVIAVVLIAIMLVGFFVAMSTTD